MIKSVWCYTLFGLLTLSGCGSESDVPSDLDNDGIIDALDCAPQNDEKWVLKSYQSRDADLDGKFIEESGEICIGQQLPAEYGEEIVIAAATDCDDSNSRVWVLRAFNSLDKDLDSKYSWQSGEVCSGDVLPDGYLEDAAEESKLDCNDNDKDIWRIAVTYRDSDKDGYGTGEQQNTCFGRSLPTSLTLIPGDCDDTNPQAWAVRTYQAEDKDLDGVFVSAEGGLCAGNTLPTGFLDSLSYGLEDCNDSNPAIFKTLNYSAVDMDLDGYQLGSTGTECTGGSLSSTYQAIFDASKEPDCNDSNSSIWRPIVAYEDTDNDGYGAGVGANYCVAEQLPDNLSINSSDCNDSNSALFKTLNYSAVDMDLDGYQLNIARTECTGGTLSETFQATFDFAQLPDCDDNESQIWRSVIAYDDADDDSYGTGVGASYCIGLQLPQGLSLNASDCNDSNSIIFENVNYLATDMDLDGYQLSVVGTECTGGTLSGTFQSTFNSSQLPDCNDDDDQSWRTIWLYEDSDNDSRGAGDETEHCYGDTQPAQWVLDSSDCDDTNVDIWRNYLIYPDLDADSRGAITGEALTCIGDQPPNGTVFDSTDCNDNNINIWRTDLAYDDIDGDGIGAGPEQTYCTNAQVAPGTSYDGYDCDDYDSGIFRRVVIYSDADGDGIGAGQGTITCMGNSYLDDNLSIFGYDPEPNDAGVSSFDLSPAILTAH